MKSPCEVFASRIIPVIRGEIARELVARGHKKKEVAGILGITVAAVSQYVHGKRGVGGSEKLKARIKEIADEIERGNLSEHDLSMMLCELCTLVKSENNAEQV